MIGSLQGSIIIRDDPFLIVDVAGVGYRIHASQDVLSSITEQSSAVKVFTYTHVREDILELYGFSKYSDLKLFESLINVSGVGPKTAIGIFSVGSSDQIKQAIFEGDVSFFTSVPRLGSKNAQKIIIELKNKVGGGELDLTDGTSTARGEVSAALKAFGFTTAEINDAVRSIDGKHKSVEEQVKAALKYLGK
ncbi:MAG: Holliday junction DNA helicase RuvA [Candidatus Levybacteria bacterium RIFCSPHIGHO2_01_FULL_40_10]|nr:MAG: Holliday junction DNA helicase RuvA [Candidatus Levybacteria bacterium RIFCSPHIGHO2_01_FULL_40_10]